MASAVGIILQTVLVILMLRGLTAHLIERSHESIDAQLLRIFIGESDKYRGRPLYEAIVLLAREHDIAGATVVRGIMGFGAHSRMHTAKLLRLSEDLPMVIEIVDKPDKIQDILPELDQMIEEGLVTLEPIKVISYRNTKNKNSKL